jgi:hypothetical protein
MSVNFSKVECQDGSKKKLFGLCDDRPGQRAYLDEEDGRKWIAVVINEDRNEATFTAIDHCIEVNRPDGKPAKRCDGFLSYESTVIFVELKERGALGNEWVKDGEEQLRTSIGYFRSWDFSEQFTNRKAYIANSEHPKFKVSQLRRMEQFLDDTGFVLRIENRIILQ